MCTGSMIRPVAAMTTVRYDSTYQCAGVTPSNAGTGSVPNEPPMISIVTTGNAKTHVNVKGSRAISKTSARSRRTPAERAAPTAVAAASRAAGAKCGGRTGVHYAAGTHHNHAVAQRLGLIHLVRHQQHRRAGVA